MSTKAVALVFVLVVSVAACRERPEAGSPPLRLAGRLFMCAQEYAGYGDRFYPPNHPTLPPKNVRPTGCFNSPDEARKAGYTLAQTPRGDRLVSGVYLAPSPAGLLTRCRRAARRLGFPVPCPHLLPTRQTEAYVCGPCGGEAKFVRDVAFIGPSSYAGMGPYGGEGHLVVAGARRLLDIECFGARAGRSTLELDGRPTEWLRCPSGSETHSGHVVLRWRDSRAAYTVSIHGDTPANQLLAAALAGDVRVVR